MILIAAALLVSLLICCSYEVDIRKMQKKMDELAEENRWLKAKIENLSRNRRG